MAKASEYSFPWDASELSVQQGNPDREYLADEFAEYFRAFISSGVFMEQSTNLQVIANGDMSITVKPGRMIIDGYRYKNREDIIINLSPADGILSRIDRISITWDKESREISCTIQEGVKSSNPIPLSCRRQDEIKDYVLADVMINAGTISISQSDITDQRINSEICGLAVPFDTIDTTTIFNQFTAWLEQIKASGESELSEIIQKYTTEANELLEEMRDILDDSAAGYLQMEIDDVKIFDEQQTERIDTLGNAVNDHNDSINSINNKLKITEKTLAAGATTITITDSRITKNSMLSLYTSKYGVNPTAVSVAAGKVTMTFAAQPTAMEVGVKVDG